MKSKKLLLVVILINLCIFLGCSSSHFDSDYKQFKESYILATDFIEKDKDPLKALKAMNVSTVENERNNMSTAMNNMNTEVKSKTQKGIYNNVEAYYKSVDFLLEAAKKCETLSTEEKGKVINETLLVRMNRKSIKLGKE